MVRASVSGAIDLGLIPSGRSGKSVPLGCCRLGFNSKSDQTNDFKIRSHSFPAGRSALKGQYGAQAGKFTCCAFGKGT